MILAIDTEYDEVTKIPFLCSMSDGKSSTLLYPDEPQDRWIIKQICESDEIEKVFHSATSDMYAFHRIGIRVSPPYHCTYVMSNLIDENFSSKKLKDLAVRYLREPCLEYQELKKIKTKYKKKMGKDFRWSKIPKDVIEPYAVKDAEYTYRLYKYLAPKITNYRYLYKLEIDLIPVILKMQIRGSYIDRSFCLKEIQSLEEAYAYYYSRLIQANGKIFNLQSNVHLRELLLNTGIRIETKTAKGAISTNKDVLTPLAKKYSIIQWILNCRNASKQIGTYYLPLLEEYTSVDDPVAHFAFWQSGTKSGRFSAELIQTIPKEQTVKEIPNIIRRAFVPRPGYTNFYFDYDQVEMKLFAHFTNNETLINAIIKGLDTHETTAIEILGKEKYNEDPKNGRRIAKTINFGIVYGMGVKSLANKLDMPINEADIFLSKYDHKYRVKAFISKMTSLLFRQGYISLDWIKREYRVPKDLAYKAINILIQGSAAYIIKLAMRRISRYLESIHGVNMLIQMHDELIFEIHDSLDQNKIVNEIKTRMEDLTTFRVPITVSVDYSKKSWLDKKSWKF